MKAIKEITMFIIFLFSINFGLSQLDYDNNVEINPQLHDLKFTNCDSIIHSIPTPPGMANGITFDGYSLWVASTDYSLYKVSPIDGEIQKTLGIEIGYATGITFVDPNLYVVDRIDKRICKIDTASGNVIDFFNTPEFNTDGFPSGLTWDGYNLWYNCAIVDTIYEINLSGQVLSKHKIFGSVPTGLTFDTENLWSINPDSEIIYQISLPNFVLIDSIDAPGPISNGLAFDGDFLWVSENSESLIYQIDIGNTTNIGSNKLVGNPLKVWPNPTYDIINIELPAKNETSNFELYNLEGQLIKSFQLLEKSKSSSRQLRLTSMKSGIYILTTNLKGKSLSRKIVVK